MLLLWHLKSYLPAHSILRGFVALHLCNFADAIRAGSAEAKVEEVDRARRVLDAIRAGSAEAKVLPFSEKLDVHDAIRAGVFRSRR